ncbi:hypothetical protein LOSG293_110770 [Secundilactobacillus oryzae JCM 18671]|uniref:Uncharacterized protein n=1 Tax=Secundilactobacillus oryzae JCM 18671 TaxID=1291743 RepID=A0A081BI93_9LACO|nr:hypothetical protein [Secundilactobacillus oryzae]GAK47761.1 hypothetical protein LOSG293_110770 [Secundilactobacillus oryzae JCM 18671]
MKFNKIMYAGLVTLSFGTVLFTGYTKANAASWHSSAIPAKLRAHWRAKQNYGYSFKITKHAFKYSGESTCKNVKWKYRGNNFYYLKSNQGTILVHYFNHHKLTSNSMWHTYTK